MPWSITVNDQIMHTGKPGCCAACDSAASIEFSKATSHVGAVPEPMASQEIVGEYDNGRLYELTVNPTALQMAEILRRAPDHIVNVNVLSRRDFATTPDMKHLDMHAAMTQYAHPLATQERGRKLSEGIGRWRAVAKPGTPITLFNFEGFPVKRALWPVALCSALPEGLMIGDTDDYGVRGMRKGHHKASSPEKHERESANTETLHAIHEHLRLRTPESHAAVLRAQEAARKVGVADADFDESEHPRAKGGEFTKKGRNALVPKALQAKRAPSNQEYFETTGEFSGQDFRIDVNPTGPLLNRLLNKHHDLRMLMTPDSPDFAVAPADVSIHADLIVALKDYAHPLADESLAAFGGEGEGGVFLTRAHGKVVVTSYEGADVSDTDAQVPEDEWPDSLRKVMHYLNANTEESEHPRAKGGEFTSKGGGASASKETKAAQPKSKPRTEAQANRDFSNMLVEQNPVFYHEVPGDEVASIKSKGIEGDYGIFARVGENSNFVTSKVKTVVAFKLPKAIRASRVVPDMPYAHETKTPQQNYLEQHPDLKGGDVSIGVDEIPPTWIQSVKVVRETETAKGKAFVSPNIAVERDFPHAVAGLHSKRQHILEAASHDIDKSLGLRSHDLGAVGAWSDGAENSVMSEIEGGTFEQLCVAAAMKAAIAEQKAALVFQDAAAGNALLYSFQAKGSLDTIHAELLDDGVAFHTVVPTGEGATVYVVDTVGDAHHAVAEAAQRYQSQVTVARGRAEFLGTEKQDGTDREQRDDALAAYGRIISGSGVQGAQALWERIHHAYGEALHLETDSDFEESEHPRDKGGQFTSGGSSGITVEHEGDRDRPAFTIKKDGKKIGRASATGAAAGRFIDIIQLEKEHQNKGYSKAIYDQIEGLLGHKLVPSPLGLSPQATAVWKKRLAALPHSERKALVEKAKSIGREFGLSTSHLAERLDPIVKDRAMAKQTIDIKFIDADGEVEINFPPDWTLQQIRNALEESNQLQQSQMYFGNPLVNSRVFERQIEGLDAEDDAEFKESEHPRGNPENAGEFTSKGGGTSSAEEPETETTKALASAHLVPAPADRAQWPAHLQKLRVPPAWTNVRISPDPDANLLVQGRDVKNRWQSIYHEKFKATQAQAKFARIAELNKKFDAIKAQNDLNRAQGDDYTKQHADITSLIMAMGIRPGSERDTGAKLQAYGATTLLGKHLVHLKSGPRLRFIGKDGVSLDLQVTDPKIAKILERRAKQAGPSGQLFPNVSDASLRDYIHLFDGGGFKTKDIRTLLGTRTAAGAVAQAEAPKDASTYKKAVRAIAVMVSQKLGNTPAIALQSYIDPSVWQPWKSVAGVP